MNAPGAGLGGLQIAESGSGAALLLLHGFTGAAEIWRPFHDSWSGFRLLAPDLPGHGGSVGPDATIPATVDALLAALDDRDVSRFALLGYSMGGRIAQRLALRVPSRISALILESASPGIADPGLRADRVTADRALADRIEREGIEAFVDHWQSLPLWASQARLPQQDRDALRAQRLRNSPAGLAASLRDAGAGVAPPVLDDLPSLTMPVLLIAGALDPVYCDHARLLAGRFPRARLEIVQDAGHAVHLEQPRRFAAIIGRFLAGLGT